jgi:hypothetical protein
MRWEVERITPKVSVRPKEYARVQKLLEDSRSEPKVTVSDQAGVDETAVPDPTLVDSSSGPKMPQNRSWSEILKEANNAHDLDN